MLSDRLIELSRTIIRIEYAEKLFRHNSNFRCSEMLSDIKFKQIAVMEKHKSNLKKTKLFPGPFDSTS